MKNITALVYDVYEPYKAIVLHRCKRDNDTSIYAEAFDLDKQGKPFNACPLSSAECDRLAQMMQDSTDLKTSFLQPKGVIPSKVLHINTQNSGYAIWYTPVQTVNLFFKDSLQIPSGKANVPAMVWKATKENLYVYIIKDKKRPDEQSILYEAPYFNLYEDAKVCMGTVSVEFEENCCLEEFIQSWENYFWNSKFSHLIQNHSPVSCNIVQLWQGLIEQDKHFPMQVLRKNGLTLKDIIE